MIQVCVCVCIYAKVDGVCDRKSFERRKTETAARTAGLLCVTIAIKAGPLSGYRGMGGGRLLWMMMRPREHARVPFGTRLLPVLYQAGRREALLHETPPIPSQGAA